VVNIPSRYIENAVDQVSSLPGIGRKTALRLVLALLKRKPEDIERFASSLTDLHANTRWCKQCNNLSDTDLCTICSSPFRDNKTVCVVGDIRDVMAIEGTGQYQGKYHVLGGIISPMDGGRKSCCRRNYGGNPCAQCNHGRRNNCILFIPKTQPASSEVVFHCSWCRSWR
jgi:recombination protein RecR